MENKSLLALYQLSQAIFHSQNIIISSLMTFFENCTEDDEEFAAMMRIISDNNNDIPRLYWTKNYSHGWWDFVVPLMSDKDFVSYFRVNRELFNHIVHELGNEIRKNDTSFRRAINVQKRVGISLHVLSSCCEYKTIAALFGVGVTTVHSIFDEFITAANKILVPKWIKWPTTTAEITEKTNEFENLWGFPQAIAAVDGCHIPVSPPEEQSTEYYNYKGWHSIVTMALSDATGKALYVKTGCPGKAHDSAIFRGTKLYRRIMDGDLFPQSTRTINDVQIPFLILGDSAFRLESWLMKPFVHRGTLSEEQKYYNKRLSRARRAVENMFARVKGRWRRILKKMEVEISRVSAIVNVAFALHNMCETNNIFYDQEWTTDNGEAELPQPDIEVADFTNGGDAENIRNALQNFFTAQRTQNDQ